jgi:hypothetical protein
MTISKRYASTVFDRSNHSIVDVIEMSSPTPVTYAAQDFFAFYEYIFKVDLNSTDFPTSTPYSFLLTITSYLQNSGEDNQLEPLGGSPQRRLQEFLATPVIIYNDAWLGSTVSDPDMGKTLSLAIASYSVHAFIVAHLTNSYLFLLLLCIHLWSAGLSHYFGVWSSSLYRSRRPHLAHPFSPKSTLLPRLLPKRNHRLLEVHFQHSCRH